MPHLINAKPPPDCSAAGLKRVARGELEFHSSSVVGFILQGETALRMRNS